MFARFLLTVLLLLVPVSVLASSVAAQGSDTVFDEVDVLSDPDEQRVQEAFDRHRRTPVSRSTPSSSPTRGSILWKPGRPCSRRRPGRRTFRRTPG